MSITNITREDTLTEQGRYITVKDGLINDVNLYVEDTGGTGRPVVLIHGWPLSGESWVNQVSAFKNAGYRVITYDRRGFGRSDKPLLGYKYDVFAQDLNAILDELDVTDATLVGFSMGGGEVARYISKYGTDRLHSIIFASSITPYLEKTSDNPDGPLEKKSAAKMTAEPTGDRDAFFVQFAKDFYSADGQLTVSQEEVDEAVRLAEQSDQKAALASLAAFGTTDFREDLTKVDIPALVIQGDADYVVFFEGSGRRTHEAIADSELVVLKGAPHGVNVSNATAWNSAVLNFLAK